MAEAGTRCENFSEGNAKDNRKKDFNKCLTQIQLSCGEISYFLREIMNVEADHTFSALNKRMRKILEEVRKVEDELFEIHMADV